MTAIVERQTAGHYRIGRLLGQGGMGAVYEGFDETLERPVALKAIRAEHRLSAQSRARFLREARVLSRLDHPNICRIYDYVEGTEQDFLVLERIEGRSLSRVIADGVLDRRHALGIAERIGGVLVAAHAAGIVHRDLKPDNVMLTDKGEPKVLDFGLARSGGASPPREAEFDALDDTAEALLPPAEGSAGDDPDVPEIVDATRTFDAGDKPTAPETQTLLTVEGTVHGTPMFMSPEQAAGGSVSAASDMYSFGLLLQKLFTGRDPYDRSDDLPAFLKRVRRAETRPVQGLDRDLTELIERLKSRAPGARPTSAETAARLRWIRDKPRRRLRNAAIAAVVVIVVAATAKYTIDLSRARDIAEARRRQAEDLSEFMLFDLRDRLEPIGRLDLLEAVGAKAMDYFAAAPPGDLTEDELHRHARALTQIGEVRRAQGDLPGALEAFRESLGLAQEIARRDPDNRERQLGLAASHFWVGYVAWRQDRLDEATAAFEAYREIAEVLVERHPDDTEVRLELGYAHSNLGSVLEARGDFEGALKQYRKCLAVEQSLAFEDPDSVELQLDVANSHNAIGNALTFLGRLDDAAEHYRTDLAIKQRVSDGDPDNMTWRHYLAVSHNLLANAHRDLGRPDEALEDVGQSVAIGQALVAHDPSNALWALDLAINLRLRANLDLERQGQEAPRDDLDRSIELLRDLTLGDPSDPEPRGELARSLATRARWALARGRPVEAERGAREALALIAPLRLEDPDDTNHRLAVADAEEVLGAALAASGRVDEARAGWERGLAQLDPSTGGTFDLRMLARRGRLLALLGRTAEASEVAGQLAATGYRNAATLDLIGRGAP